MKIIHASDFEARCSAVLDRIHRTGERIVILKDGQPIVEIGPVTRGKTKCPQHELRGTAAVRGDIIGPVLPEDHRESLKP